MSIDPKDINNYINNIKIRDTDEYEFSIFYTFTFNEHSVKYIDLTGFDMLLLSIASALREFQNKVKIFIYTTDVDDISNRFNIYPTIYPFINIKLYNPIDYNNEDLYNNEEYINHFNDIGHSRIFSIKSLLIETKKPVIYLDNDTVINKNAYLQIKEILLNLITPISCCIEFDNSFVNLFNDYISHEMNHLKIINNGIIIYPYNENIFNFIDDTINIYNELKLKYKTIFNDMFAHTIACNKYNYFDVLSIKDPEPNNIPPIFHYFIYKYVPKNNIIIINLLLNTNKSLIQPNKTTLKILNNIFKNIKCKY